jgi:hypothetical protein
MEYTPRKQGGLSSAALLLICACFLLGGKTAVADTPDTAEAAPFRVRLQDLEAAQALRSALQGADERLSQPACRNVLTDFLDSTGSSLRTRIDSQGVSERAYLRWIVFAEDRHRGSCRSNGALAVTEPGSRVVFICPVAFARAAASNPELAEATVIHEMLHTLGLGENPPSSTEITARVLARCAPSRPRGK